MVTTLSGILTASATVHPDRLCLVTRDSQYTYREINQAANAFAHGLLATGIKPGDKVAVLISNRVEFVVCFFGVLKTGAVCVPVNVKYKSEELRYVVDHSDAAVLVLSEEFRDVLGPVRETLIGLEWVIWVEASHVQCEGGQDVGRIQELGYGQLLARHPRTEPSIKIRPDDDALMFYTSGTTGKPKGAVCTHRNCLAAIDGWVEALHISSESRSLMVTPFFHNAFNAFVVTLFRAGGSTVLVESFQMKSLLAAIISCRPTLLFATPSIYITLVEGANSADFESLRTLVYGAAPMPVEVIKRLRQVCPDAELYNAYAQSETCPAISFLEPQYALSKAGSVGKAVRGVTIAILDDTHQALPPMAIGEICCRGAHIMKGYHRQPDKTAEKIVDGWLHTGDMGYLDHDGFLFLVNRKDDLIITGGENLYPQEVEEVLYTHPDIQDAAVVGVPHPVRGQVVAAFVVFKLSTQAEPVKVRRFCSERLANFKVPRHIIAVESLPRNASGKVVRADLLHRFTAMSVSVLMDQHVPK
ncbi:MAG: long-chain-fatty-acid--CoA ligase [Nitrospira sp.]